MDYQKPIKESYLVEGTGYALAASGVGAIIYGLTEKDMGPLKLGVGNLISGAGIAFMGRIVRKSAQETQQVLPSPLETEVESTS